MKSRQINLQARFPSHRCKGSVPIYNARSTSHTVYPPAADSTPDQLPAPLITLPISEPYTSHDLFTLNCENAAAAIYYTLDGSTPTAESTLYTEPFAPYQVGTITIKAIAILEGFLDSDITEETVTLTALPLAQPVLILSSVLDVSLLVSWAEIENASGYILDVATDSGFTSFLSGWEAKDLGDVTSISVPGLTPATTYYFRLIAYHTWGQSSPSDTASTITYIYRDNVVFIVDPQRPDLFEYSDDLTTFSPCVVNGEIVNSRVNRITCAVTGSAMLSSTTDSALIIAKDDNGKYRLMDVGTQAWLYSAPVNLLSSSGQQISGVAAYPERCLMHLYNTSVVTGSFTGRSSAYYHGIFYRRHYLSTAAALVKRLLRTVACTSDPADTYIIENQSSVDPLYNAGILVNSPWFGQDLGSWNNIVLYLWAIYSPTTDQSLIQNRHNAIARYLGGIGGPVIEEYSA